MSAQFVLKNMDKLKKSLIEIKHFAVQKKTSRTSVYRAIYSEKLNHVVLGKSSKFIILDDSAKSWKPGKTSAKNLKKKR